MSDDREQEAREEHPKRDDRRTCERVCQAIMYISTLEPHEGRKDNERCRQNVANRDAIDEDLLGEPAAEDHCLCLDEGDCGVRPAEGKAAGDEAEDEEVCEIWDPCDAECQ